MNPMRKLVGEYFNLQDLAFTFERDWQQPFHEGLEGIKKKMPQRKRGID